MGKGISLRSSTATRQSSPTKQSLSQGTNSQPAVKLLVFALVLLINAFLASAFTIKLDQGNITADTYITSGNANTNYGTRITLYLMQNSSKNMSAFIKVDLTSIPAGATINNASLNLYITSNSLDNSSEGYNVSAHHVYNQTWAETFPTWNNRLNLSFNDTIMSSINFTGGAGAQTGWQTWDVSNAVITDYNLGNVNSSFYLESYAYYGNPITTDNLSIASAEYSADTSLRPYVNVSYTDTTAPAIYINVSRNNTLTTDNTPSIEFNFTDVGPTANCTLYFNGTGYGETTGISRNTPTALAANATLSNGRYDVWINCTDESNYTNKSSVLNISISNEITACANLTGASATYILMNNVNSSGTCFKILADNITLEGNGYIVNFSTSAEGVAINISGNNTLVKGLMIMEGSESNSQSSAVQVTGQNATVRDISISTIGYETHGVYITADGALVQNLTISTSNQASAGILIGNSANHRLINNTISTLEDYGYGIYLSSVTNATLSGNKANTTYTVGYFIDGTTASHYNHTINSSNLAEGLPIVYNFSVQNADMFTNQNLSNTYGQLICAWCNNVTYRNISMSRDGISLFNTTSGSVINSSISTTNGHGIVLSQCSDGLVRGSNIYLDSGHSSGIYLYNSQRSTIAESSITTELGTGIYLDTDTNSTIANSTIRNNNEFMVAFITYATTNAKLINVTTENGGAFYIQSTNSITLDKCKFQGITQQVYANYCDLNINATDTIINASASDQFEVYIDSTCGSFNLSFTNVTRSNGNSLNISWDAGVSGTLYNSWWLDANVTYGSLVVSGATVNATNALGTKETNTTSSNGLARISLLQYKRNNTGGTDYTYYSNYTVNASKGNFFSNSSTLNITTNRQVWLSLGNGSGPAIYFVPPTDDNLETINRNWSLVNVTVNSSLNTSAFIDWNRSLVGWWSFESYNSTGIYDNSTYQNFGTFQGGLSTDNITTGKYGKALTFDGVNDFVNVPDSSNLDITGNITIMAWVYLKDGAANHNIVHKDGGTSTSNFQFYFYTSVQELQFDFYNGGWNNHGTSWPGFNGWHHVAVTYDGSYVTFYKDGIADAPEAENTAMLANNYNVTIGASLYSGSYNDFFNGTIDEVRIFNRALSEEEINATYNTGSYRLYHNFTDLAEGTYNFTAYAIDELGNINKTEERTITVNTSAGATSNWANTSFDKCMNITITSSGSETLTNFPAYINLTYDSDMQPNFIDIRFYEGACNNSGSILDYEIENYTTSTNAHTWVRIPTLTSPSTAISIYYKNNTAVGSGQNPNGVWDNNYIGVWHMQRVNATDSTRNGNNGTATSAGTIVFNSSGKIDGAVEFDGSAASHHIKYSNNSVLSPANITMEAWVYMKATNPPGVGGPIIWKYGQYDLTQQGSSSHPEFTLCNATACVSATPSGWSSLDLNKWYYIVATYKSGELSTYLNGSYMDTRTDLTGPLNVSSDNFSIGGHNYGNEFNGTIDEVRISNMTRSANWINQTYLMTNNQSQFVEFGEEENRTEATLNISLNLNPNPANTNQNISFYGHLNLTDGTSIGNNSISIYINNSFYYLNNNTGLLENTTAWWNTSYSYRTKINITSLVTSNLNSTIVLVNLSTSDLITAGKMKADCGDTRFTDSNGNELQYTTETSTCNKTNTIYWVWTNLTGNANNTIYAYYGNSNAALKTNYINSDSSLVLYYHFDNDTAYGENSTKTYDFSKNNNNGTIIGTPTWNSTGRYGGAYNLNEGGDVGDYIQAASPTAFDFTNFTYSIWINTDLMGGGWRTIIDVDNDEQQFAIDDTGKYAFYGRCGQVSLTNAAVGWRHLAWTVSGSNYVVYENGTIIGSGSGCSASADGDYLVIGSGYGGNEYFSGLIDEVRIYNRTLSADEILAIYNSTAPNYIANQSLLSTDNNGNYNYTWSTSVASNYSVKANASYQGTTTEASTSLLVIEVDSSAPSITGASANPRFAHNGTAINISSTVTDDISVGTVIARIYYPNGTSAANYTMSNSGGGSTYWNASYISDFSIPRIYNITIWANDTVGNSNTSQTNFTPILNLTKQAQIVIDGSLNDWVDYSVSTLTDSSEDNNYVLATGISVSIFERHACELLSNGSGYCWGYGGSGRLGDGNEDLHNATVPVPINTTPNLWKNISVGYYHSCGIKLNGSLYCWGYGAEGQLGDGSTNGHDEGNPIPVNMTDNNWTMVSLGISHTCGIHANGTGYCWGSGQYGRLGYGNESSTHEEGNPVPINISNNTWSYISAGRYSTCGIHANGTAYCWGLGSMGRLGDGDETVHNQTNPVAVQGGLNNFIAITAYDRQSCGIVSNGSLYCWGDGDRGKVGDGNINDHNVTIPVAVNITPNNWSVVSAGELHTCGVHVNGSAYCWGEGNYGQLGDGNNESHNVGNPQPINISNNTFSTISAGYVTTCAIHGNGTTYCWGDGQYGRMGDGIQDYHEIGLPTQVNYTIIDASSNFEITNYSIANDNAYLFAKFSVNGSIDFRDPSKYYAIYLSTNNPSTGSQYGAGGATLPFLYDYRIQINNSVCNIYNYTNGTIGACNYNNNSNTIELSAQLSLINMTTASKANITFETGGSSYDFAPDYNSFLEYEISEAANWANNNLIMCKNITIANSGSEELVNFPAYINLTYDSDMQPDFKDIRFYMESCNNGNTSLDYEIENYTTSTNAHIWVRIPRLPSTGKVISIYYKNSSAITDGQNPAGVWDNYYKAVWHMTKADANDSTSNGYNGTATGGGVSQNSNGKIDGADDFDGSSYVSVDPIDFNYPISYECWFKVNSLTSPGDKQMCLGRYYSGFGLGLWNGAYYYGSVWNGTGGAGSFYISGIQTSTWNYLALTYNGSQANFYINGQKQTPLPTTGSLVYTDYKWEIGTDGNEDYFLNGTADEIRISNTTRSANWINQTYLMINNQNNYVSFGNEMAMISSCQNLTSNNTYYLLTQNVTSQYVCFDVMANNITLDCDGYTVNYSTVDGDSVGINNNRSNDNIIVKNCRLIMTEGGYGTGINYMNTRNGALINNSIIVASWGVDLYNSSNVNISGNTINTTLLNGADITLEYYSDNVTVKDNILIRGTSNNWPWWYPENIVISSCKNATLTNNTMNNSRWGSIRVDDYYAAYRGSEDAVYFNHTIGQDNTVNGKPVMFIGNANNTVYRDQNWSGYDVVVGLINNVTFTNLSLSGISFCDKFRNSELSNSTITSSTTIPLQLSSWGNTNNMVVKNNIINNYGDSYAVAFAYTINGLDLINNTITSTGNSYAAVVQDAGGSGSGCFYNLYNNTINATNSIGFYGAPGYGTSNIISGNTIITSGSAYSYGIILLGNLNYTYMSNNRITSSGYAINNYLYYSVYGENDRIIMNDSFLNSTSTADIYVNEANYGPMNLTNVTLAHENISFSGSGNQTVNRLWYVQTNIRDKAGSSIGYVNITINDKDSVRRYNGLTGTDGQITRQALLQYWMNRTNSYYYSNYTVNATRPGYYSNQSSTNLTASTIVNLTLSGLPLTINISITPTVVNSSQIINITGRLNDSYDLGVPNHAINFYINNTKYTYNSGTGRLVAGDSYDQPITDSNGYYNYSFAAPLAAGGYIIKVNTTNIDYNAEANTTFTVTQYYINITADISPSTVNISQNFTVYGHANDSNGINISNTSIYIYIDGVAANITESIYGGATWWNAYWKYRTKIYEESYVSTSLNNTIIMLNFSTSDLISQSKMRSDCGDIRFADSNKNELQYTIETSTCNTTNTICWVWTNLTGNANTTIYVYYGNSAVTLKTDYTNPDNSLVAYYHFDNNSAYGEGSSKVYDFSKAGNNGTIGNGNEFINTTGGKFGGAVEFDGTGDYVNISNSQSLNITNEITVMAWVKLRSTQAYITIAQKSLSSWYAWQLYARQSDTPADYPVFRIDFGADQTWNEQAVGPSILSTDIWYHLVGRYNGTQLIIYQDGQAGSTYNITGTIPTSSSGITLGYNDVWTSETMDGWIDDFRIYNRSLSTDEILAIYNSTLSHYITNETGTATDNYGNYNVTVIAPATPGTYEVKVNISYNYNTAYDTATLTVLDPGIIITNVNANPRFARNGSIINISASVTTAIGTIDKVVARIHYPNGTSAANYTMSNGGSGSTYWNDSHIPSFSIPGLYNFTIYANKTNSINNESNYYNFTPILNLSSNATIAIDGAFSDWSDASVPNISDNSNDTMHERFASASIMSGGQHTCGILINGSGYCWGFGSDGQLGDGSDSAHNASVPVPINISPNIWSKISPGQYHTCGIHANGTAYCWGSDYQGRLGNGEGWYFAANPYPINISNNNFTEISVGYASACAVHANGSTYCWGEGQYGKIGDGNVSSHIVYSPSAVNTTIIFTKISVGDEHTCAIATNGSAYCWGHGLYGRLGDGNADEHNATTPTPVLFSSSNWTAISAGGDYTCGILTNGSSYCWGSGLDGQLGDGSTGAHNYSTPNPVNFTNNNFTRISAGSGGHTCAVHVNGSGFCWGLNNAGELGDGYVGWDQKPNPNPLNFTNNNFTSISAGRDHTCGIHANGSSYCWGAGSYGRLGNGDETYQDVGLPSLVNYLFVNYAPSYEIESYSLAHNNDYLYAKFSVTGKIDFSNASKYYAIYLSTNDLSTGSIHGIGGASLPFLYDYRIQINGTSCTIYNYTNQSQGTCDYSNDTSTIELRANLTLISLTTGSTANLTLETGSITGNSYDVAPEYNSFIEYIITQEAQSPLSIYFTDPTDNTGTINRNWSYVNVTVNSSLNTSAFIDWNKSLVGWWSFESHNASGIYDNSTYNNFATFKGGLTENNITTGKYGNALVFDGSNDYAEINDSGSSPLDMGSVVTIEAWVKIDSYTANYYTLASKYQNYWLGFYDHSWMLTFFSGDWQNLDGSTFNTGQWYHVVGIIDNVNNLTRLYVNGHLDNEDTNENADMVLNDNAFYLGKTDYGYPYLNGTLDEVRIWNRALSPEEINASYNAGAYRLYHNFTGLAEGNYTFKAYAIDALGNINSTEQRNITVNTSIQVTACGELSIANATYTLLNDVNSTGTCFNITAFNVTIDAQGHMINYSTVGTVGYGVYSNQNFSVIKNAIIVEGSSSGTYKYGIYYQNASNGTIQNVTIRTIAATSDGIYLYYSEYSLIINNNITDYGNGIYLYYSDANTVRNNLISTTAWGGYPIVVDHGSNETIDNNTVISSGAEATGITLAYSSGCNLTNNKANSSASQSYVIRATSSSHCTHTIDTSNLAEGSPVNYTYNVSDVVYDGVDFSSYGEVIFGCSRNITLSGISFGKDALTLVFVNTSTFKDLVINTNVGNGLLIRTSSYNNFRNFTINNSGSFGMNIYGSTYNNFTNFSLTTNSRGVIFWESSYHNVISNAFINTTTSEGAITLVASTNLSVQNVTIRAPNGIGLNMYSGGGNNSFRALNIVSSNSPMHIGSTMNLTITDSQLNRTNGGAQVYVDSDVNGGSWNFTNVSRIDGSTLNISWNASGNGTLNYGWWLDANVTSGGTALESATVNATSALGTSKDNITGSNGLTRIALIEYTRNNTGGTDYTYYSNYTINATKIGYYYNSTVVNMTTNRMVMLSLQSESSCICPGAGSNWNINMTHSCNITSDCDITTGYLNFTDTGYARFNATINCTGMHRPEANQIVYIEKNALILVHNSN